MKEIHVSVNGNDRGSGTAADPVRTLGRAREMLCEVGRETRKRLLLGPGRHDEVCLELEARDSHLVIQSAGDVPAVLCGGRRIHGWRRESSHFFAAELSGMCDGRWDFRMLAVNGQWRPRARFPEQGFLECLNVFDVPWMSTTGGGWKRPPTPAELGHLEYRPGDLPADLDVANAELTVYHSWDESLVGLAAHDPATRVLTFATPAGHPPGSFKNQRYVVNNTRLGMTHPGQWYVDRVRGRLVYWPLPDEDMETVEVLAPLYQEIIRLVGTENDPLADITVLGVALTTTTTPMVAGGFAANTFAGAINGIHTDGVTIRDTQIHNVGGQAIKMETSRRLRLEGCELSWTGAGGFYGSGEDARIFGNRIHHVGRTYASAVGMRIAGARHRVENNDIRHTTYSGMIGSGSDSVFVNNRFLAVMEEMNDGAAIYITFCRRMVVRGNRTSEIAFGPGLRHAYYLDEQAEDCVVENNLSKNVQSPLHGHMARRNVFRNNIMVNDGEILLRFPRCEALTLERNVAWATGAIRCRWPVGAIVGFANNVLYSATGEIVEETLKDYLPQEERHLPPRDGTVFADPRFVDAAAGNYRFAAGSPALRLGLIPLDLTMDGPEANCQEAER